MIRVALTIGVLLGVAVGPGVAAAQQQSVSDEDQRPRAALGACAAGDVKKGISILAELYAETRNPSFVFNQARCYQQNGQLEPARQRFSEYLRVGTSEPPADRARAEGFIKEIEAALAAEAARATPPPASPSVTAPVASPGPQGQDEGQAHAHSLRVAGVALAALGLVAVGAGVYLSLKVQATSRDVENRFAGMDIVTDPGSLQRQLSDGGRYETWQWVSYGIGVAALAGAATTFVLAGLPSSAEHPVAQTSVSLLPLASPRNLGGALSWRF